MMQTNCENMQGVSFTFIYPCFCFFYHNNWINKQVKLKVIVSIWNTTFIISKLTKTDFMEEGFCIKSLMTLYSSFLHCVTAIEKEITLLWQINWFCYIITQSEWCSSGEAHGCSDSPCWCSLMLAQSKARRGEAMHHG